MSIKAISFPRSLSATCPKKDNAFVIVLEVDEDNG